MTTQLLVSCGSTTVTALPSCNPNAPATPAPAPVLYTWGTPVTTLPTTASPTPVPTFASAAPPSPPLAPNMVRAYVRACVSVCARTCACARARVLAEPYANAHPTLATHAQRPSNMRPPPPFRHHQQNPHALTSSRGSCLPTSSMPPHAFADCTLCPPPLYIAPTPTPNPHGQPLRSWPASTTPPSTSCPAASA